MNHVAVVISEHLYLDMPRPLDEPFDVQRAIAERGHRFVPRLIDSGSERTLIANRFHPDAAAASRWLQQDGEADLARGTGYGVIRLIDWRLARHDWHAGFLCKLPCRNL